MKAPGILFAAIVATGQSILTANLVLAAPLGGDGGLPEALGRPPYLLLSQAPDRLSRLWQHRSILEQALQAPPQAMPEAPPALPRARPLQVPVPEPELSSVPQPEIAAVPEQVAEIPDNALSCEDAATIVADYGFSDIRPTGCSGELYRFSATRDGSAYSIGITAAAGEITEVSRE